MKNPTPPSTPLLHQQPRRAAPKHNYSLVGASLGLVAFLFVALLPSVLFGGTVAARLANGIFGADGIGLQVFVVLGVVSAVTAVASLFAVLGALTGASLGVLVRATEPRAA